MEDDNAAAPQNQEVENQVLRAGDYQGSWEERAKAALGILFRGMVKFLQLLMYLFVLFSVWFTIRTAICSLVDINDRGCMASLRDLWIEMWRRIKPKPPTAWTSYSFVLNLWNRFLAMLPNQLPSTPSTPQWILALYQPLRDFLKALTVIVLVYWARFWGVHTYRKEIPAGDEGGKIQDRLVALLTYLGEVSKEQLEEFRTYLLVIWFSAIIFAMVFGPLCWMIDLHGRASVHDSTASDNISWMSLAMREFWNLFMMHLISSSLVADTLFNAGPLMDWWTPGEQGFIWYMGISVLLTAFVYPLGTITTWWWNGSVSV